MGLFSFSFGPNINDGILEYKNTKGGILLDVRTPEEYKEAHIPSGINVPLQNLEHIHMVTDDINTPIFVYCHSGARSAQAANRLQLLGYTTVKNIGGIVSYKGEIEK